jgi:hypothetical protein
MNKTLFYTNPTFVQPTRLKFTSPFKTLDLKGLLRSKYSCEKGTQSVQAGNQPYSQRSENYFYGGDL